MTIGQRIKQLRRRKQMTQSDLVGETVSRNMLSLIENDRALPSLQTLEAIAARLKTSPAFLLADAAEQTALMRLSRMADIRLAYEKENYRICADLCHRLYEEGAQRDPEIDLILSESLCEMAREEFMNDRVRDACHLFDSALQYASKTCYYTDHIVASATLYFEYMGMLSPSLLSENLEDVPVVSWEKASQRDVVGRYIFALLSEAAEWHPTKGDPAWTKLLSTHIQARYHLSAGAYEQAGRELHDILNGEELLPGVIMYHVLGDFEECCQHLGNRKNAALYRDLRVSLFEKLLS